MKPRQARKKNTSAANTSNTRKKKLTETIARNHAMHEKLTKNNP